MGERMRQAKLQCDQEVLQLRALLQQRNDDVVQLQQRGKEQTNEVNQLRALLDLDSEGELESKATLMPERVPPGGTLEALLHSRPEDLLRQQNRASRNCTLRS